MEGETAQHLRLLQPVLVKLRGQLDEIARDIGAGDQRIGHVGEEAVQRMAEFVEQRARIVEGEKRRLALRRLGEIHDVDDDRPDVAGQPLLVAQRAHPGAAPLRRPREIVAEGTGRSACPSRRHLPDAHIGVVDRDVVELLEGEAEQPARRVEGRRDHLVELQIGLQLGLVEIEPALAHLFGIVAPVPRRRARNCRPPPAISACSSAASSAARPPGAHTELSRSIAAPASSPSCRRGGNGRSSR